ncbi:MAG: hypothetical protein R3E83_11635 [Burkholderiaceae bacterium]
MRTHVHLAVPGHSDAIGRQSADPTMLPAEAQHRRGAGPRGGAACAWIAIAFFAVDGFDILTQLNRIGINVQGGRGWLEHFKQFIFLVPHLLAIIAILSTLAMRRPIALTLLTVLFLLSAIDLSILFVLGHPASLSNISVLNTAMDHASDAVDEHLASVLIGVSLSLLLFHTPGNRGLRLGFVTHHRRAVAVFFKRAWPPCSRCISACSDQGRGCLDRLSARILLCLRKPESEDQ